MNFSVLVSSYYKDNPNELSIALRSIWDDQIIKPAEIVIVKDGPLTTQLDAVINEFSQRAPVKLVPLEKNQGLGLALAEGIKNCTYEYIARMDGDDISLPDRFEKQVKFLEQHPEVTICGGMIREFSGSPDNITGKRILPEKHQDILKFAKKRCPFNHMTVMYRKQAILQVGNYQHFPYYEDYYLWARLLAENFIAENLPDILVNVRAGHNMLARRKGWIFFTSEIALAIKFKKIKFLSVFQMLQNILMRAPVRLLPVYILRFIYIFLRKK